MPENVVPKKTLHSTLYLKLYQALKAEFKRKEWDDLEVEFGDKLGVWAKTDPAANNRLRVDVEFGVGQKFFYDRNTWAEAGKNIKMKIEIIDRVLRYMGCEGETNKELLNDFYKRKQVPPEIITAQAELTNRKRQEPSIEFNSSTERVSVENINQKNYTNFNIHISDTAFDSRNEIENLVYRFYEHIATANSTGHERAWQLMSSMFRARIWMPNDPSLDEKERDKRGLERFKNGYYFFRSLRDTHVFNVKMYPSVAYCMVYYEEELEPPYIEELADINKTAIKNAGSLIDKLNSLSKIVEEFGGKGFADKGLIRLFYPTATETLWFEHGMDPVSLKAAFPATSVTTISMLMRCRCIKENDHWVIDGLIPFHCRQI